MTRFETPGQVVLLFVGAAVVSVILVAFLNAEARNRKIKGKDVPLNAQCETSATHVHLYRVAQNASALINLTTVPNYMLYLKAHVLTLLCLRLRCRLLILYSSFGSFFLYYSVMF